MSQCCLDVACMRQVGSVSTIITEHLQDRGLQMEEAEATLLALGVHSDTGSLTFDSATARYNSSTLKLFASFWTNTVVYS